MEREREREGGRERERQRERRRERGREREEGERERERGREGKREGERVFRVEPIVSSALESPSCKIFGQWKNFQLGSQLDSWRFKPSQPQRIISGLKETFIKRYIAERTKKAEIGPKEHSQKMESCRENLQNEINTKEL